MVSEPIRVLVVDDSALVRRVLITMLESDQALRVVGEAANGREAIALVEQLHPNVITMDVRMPVMDGLATTEHIMAYLPTPILVVTASLSSYEVDITFKMLGAGALDVIEKPRMDNAIEMEQARAALIRRVKTLARVRVVTHLRGRRRSEGPPDARRPAAPPPAVRAPLAMPGDAPGFPLVVIGASTGGPRVVRQILEGLPAALPAAVIIAQHIAEGFSAGMTDWLAASSTMRVRLAREGDLLAPGEALVVPDQHDLLLHRQAVVHLSRQPVLLQRPSVDIAMQSAAACFGERTVALLLTGMGRDGAIGMLAVRRAGGHTIAQSEASCSIYGMPRAAIEAGAASEILPPEEMPAAILRAVQERMARR